jgi:hypothetical protein
MSRVRARLADESGWTMIVVMLVLMCASLFAVAAYNSVASDRSAGRYSQDQKLAYSAAQSGLAWYQAQLQKDPSYWASCQAVPQINGHAAPVWDGKASSTRTWGDVNDPNVVYTGPVPATAQAYSVELVPIAGQNACDPNNPDTTMIDSAGTFRVRVSGRSGKATRAIVATFRRKGFLDYLYYTQYETLDPALAATAAGLSTWPTQISGTDSTTFTQWETQNCGDKAFAQRQGKLYAAPDGTPGQFQPPASAFRQLYAAPPCTDVSFRSGDAVKGPLHTADPLLICDNPSFGVTSADRIEVEATPFFRDANGPGEAGLWGCGVNANATWNGTQVPNADPISPPLPNTSLASAASGCCLFQGETRIVLLSDGTMDVYNAARYGAGVKRNMPQPTNGVIYAATSGACGNYNPENVEANNSTCGDMRVSGLAKTSLTLGADNDIVVMADLKPDPSAPNALIGLISMNGYVRVAHPVGAATNDTTYGWESAAQTAQNLNLPAPAPAGQTRSFCNSPNSASPAPMNTITIQAAILALTHSFLVDNWRCGAQLTGTLTVTGAIAQKYRGPVGCNTCRPPGLTATGYLKNYQYDTRLKYRSPPAFLAPVQSAWRLARVQEQGGAAGIIGR